MFQFSGFAPTHYEFMCRSGRSQGFPHSEIAGSKPIRGSPTLIAAYHVLHRLCMPRHPPIALKTLDRSHCQCPSRWEPGWNWHKKTSFSRSERWLRLNRPIICKGLSVPYDKSRHPKRAYRREVRTNLLFTMSYRTGGKLKAFRKPFFFK